MGCDALCAYCSSTVLRFQFTHPVWGATTGVSSSLACEMFQFTHPVWGATLQSVRAWRCRTGFNSRTPCGVRPFVDLVILAPLRFQFTHPVWGATTRFYLLISQRTVSIHAPRVGCDLRTYESPPRYLGFNSRTPCGVRLSRDDKAHNNTAGFNSRTPCGVRLVGL